MEINFNDQAVIAAIERELSQPHHDVTNLNGQSDMARLFIASEPFPHDKALIDYFAKSNKGKYGMFFNSIKDSKHQQVLRHMNEQQIINYLDAKKDADKAKIINEAMSFLYLLDQAKVNAKAIEEKTVEAKKIIASTEKTLEKVKDVDEAVISNLNQKISALKKAMKDPHPSVEAIDNLITEVKNDAGNLIGEEKIASSRKYAEAVIKKIDDVLNANDTPADVKPYFSEKKKHLEELKSGTDAILIEETATQTDRELVERTDKNIRGEKRAIDGTTRNIMRIILKQMFQIKEEKYDSVLQKITTVNLAANYTFYLNSRGRIAKKLPPLETFIAVEKASLEIVIKEMVMVHNGGNDIESVINTMGGVLNLPNLDIELNNVQTKILDTDDLSDEGKRYGRIVDFLIEVKAKIRLHSEDLAGYTSEESNDLVNGSIFSDALEMIPGVLTENFLAFEQSKEKNQGSK